MMTESFIQLYMIYVIGLYELYKEFYAYLSIDKFLDFLFSTCLTNDKNVMLESEICKLYGVKFQDDLPIRLLIANHVLNKNDKRIIDLIKSYFKKQNNEEVEEDVTSRSGEDLVQCIS
jgi:hypothetical protein